jgi:hypothetical protein
MVEPSGIEPESSTVPACGLTIESNPRGPECWGLTPESRPPQRDPGEPAARRMMACAPAGQAYPSSTIVVLRFQSGCRHRGWPGPASQRRSMRWNVCPVSGL